MRDRETMELSEAEATLRLIAKLPAPDGLAERVQGRLKAAPVSVLETGAQVLQWPVRRSGWTGWARGVAAAAIVCVVAGGAWQISTHIVPGASGNAVAAPVPVPSRARPAGGFSSAGAMRTPDTLNGPVLKRKPQTGSAAEAAKKNDSTKKPVGGAEQR